MTGVAVDLYADIVCPWCFIGSERLDHVLHAAGRLETTEVTHHPFLLQPDAPPEGIDVPEMLRRKYGVEPRQIFERAEAAARESGIALDLSKQPRSYSTVPAHTLLRHAASKGTQRALVRALLRAHFVDAKNVSDPEALASIAAPHGFAADEVARIVTDAAELETTRRAAGEAIETGVRGVPFFVFGGRLAVSGAQPEAVLAEAIRRAFSEDDVTNQQG